MSRRSLTIAAVLIMMAASLLAAIIINRPAPASTAWGLAPGQVQSIMWPEALPLADVELSTQHGQPFSSADLNGQWSLMFFGYLHCPDVCPMGLSALRAMRELLESQGQSSDERFYFVSVDPSNDTPEDLLNYLAAFDATFIGLHGPEAEIQRLADSMAVWFEVDEDTVDYRRIDHSSSVMLIDPQGRMVGALPPPLLPERMAADYLALRNHLEP